MGLRADNFNPLIGIDITFVVVIENPEGSNILQVAASQIFY
jgi:hypothetical protein